jgi:hypothetical protein
MTATASGTLAGTAFSGAAITVRSVADTNQVFVAGGTSPNLDYEVIAVSTTISIAGFTSATFADSTFWEDPNGSGDIIFGDVVLGSGIGNGILGFTKLFAGLESYDLKSSFGPLSSPLDFETSVFDNFNNLPTSQGSLSLVASNDTFTAVTGVTEPSFDLIVGAAILGVLIIRAVAPEPVTMADSTK